MTSRLNAALLTMAIAGIAGASLPPIPEPTASKQRKPEVANEYKTAAQKKRERKNAKRSRNGAKP